MFKFLFIFIGFFMLVSPIDIMLHIILENNNINLLPFNMFLISLGIVSWVLVSIFLIDKGR